MYHVWRIYDLFNYWCTRSCSIAEVSASCSRLVVARLPVAQKGPGSNRAADKSLCFSRKSLRYAALGTGCTLTAVPRSRVGKWVSTLAIIAYQWRWANVRPIAAYRRTQRSSLQPGLRVGGHLALTDFRPDEPKWTLAYCWRRIDSTYKYRTG